MKHGELFEKSGSFEGFVKKTFTRRDAVLIFAALVLAGLCYFLLIGQHTGDTAVIEQNGRELYRIRLSAVTQPYELTIGGEYPAVLLVEHNGVSFQEASCPDKLCVRTGKISRTGQAAVCLPAKIVVRIVGAEKSADGITG